MLLCVHLENELEHKIYTLAEIHNTMRSLVDDGPVFGTKYLKQKLLQYYQDEIYFTSEEKRKDILCFRNTTNTILREFKDEVNLGTDERKLRLITVTAKLLTADIKAKEIAKDRYPTISDLRQPSSAVPDTLKHFLRNFTKSEEQTEIWAQNFVKSLRPRSGVMPYHLGLSLLLDHRFGAKWLIQLLHSLGYCEDYKEVNNYKWLYLEVANGPVAESQPATPPDVDDTGSIGVDMVTEEGDVSTEQRDDIEIMSKHRHSFQNMKIHIISFPIT